MFLGVWKALGLSGIVETTLNEIPNVLLLLLPYEARARPVHSIISTVGINMDKKMETTIVYWGYIGIMEKKMETTIVYWGYIGIMEENMETTIVYWGHIGVMEKKMETTIVYWGYIRIMEKNMETTIVYLGYIGIMEKKMETTIVYYSILFSCMELEPGGVKNPRQAIKRRFEPNPYNPPYIPAFISFSIFFSI